MRPIKNTLIGISTLLITGSAAAQMDFNLKPFLGIDCIHIESKTTGKLANGDTPVKKALPEYFNGIAVYAGTKVDDNLGFELGADWSTKEKTKTNLDNDPTWLYKNKASRQSFHADLIGFIPFNTFELFGSVGYGLVKIKITDQKLIDQDPVTGAHETALPNGGFPLSTKRKGVLRLGAGINYMLTEQFGLRAKFGWEGTKALRLQYAENYAPSSKSFKNSTTMSIGAFVRW